MNKVYVVIKTSNLAIHVMFIQRTAKICAKMLAARLNVVY